MRMCWPQCLGLRREGAKTVRQIKSIKCTSTFPHVSKADREGGNISDSSSGDKLCSCTSSCSSTWDLRQSLTELCRGQLHM